MIYTCASHIGKVRKNNEDYCKGEIIDTEFGSIGIFALADGMGGHKAGEVASSMAINHLTKEFDLLDSIGDKKEAIKWIRKQVEEINNEISILTLAQTELMNKEIDDIISNLEA